MIYPPACGFCGKLDSEFLCDECKKKMKILEKAHIDKYCDKEIYFNEHIYLFKYEGEIRNKIIDYKFRDNAYYYESFVNILLNNEKICEILKSYDIMMAVPMHNKKIKQRGYNQTELIAKSIAKKIKELKYANILCKKNNTQTQSLLNKEQRRENVNGAYELQNIQIPKGKNILIVDDIYTTGSTANECAKIVRGLNPFKIGILTIAKD